MDEPYCHRRRHHWELYGRHESCVESLVSHRKLLESRLPLTGSQPSPPTPWNSNSWYVARHGLLPDALLPSLPHRQAYRPVFHSSTSIRRCRRPRLGRLPENGRSRRPRWLPMDVPSLRPCWHHRRLQPVMVAP